MLFSDTFSTHPENNHKINHENRYMQWESRYLNNLKLVFLGTPSLFHFNYIQNFMSHYYPANSC